VTNLYASEAKRFYVNANANEHHKETFITAPGPTATATPRRICAAARQVRGGCRAACPCPV
jgi:hypothetical protein